MKEKVKNCNKQTFIIIYNTQVVDVQFFNCSWKLNVAVDVRSFAI